MPDVIIRNATSSDAAAIRDIYAPFVTDTIVSFESDPPDAATMAARMSETMKSHPYLVAEHAGAVVGYCYASRYRARPAYDKTVEIGAYISAEHRGAGLGRQLYTAILNDLSARSVHSALATIALPNAQSVGFHESLGFQAAGRLREVGWKFGKWHDTGRWQLLLADWQAKEQT
jgi:phosphinothricin acetyltransferase